MAGLFQRIAQNYRKKKKITQPSARLNAKEDKTEHAGKVTRAKERIVYYVARGGIEPPFQE